MINLNANRNLYKTRCKYFKKIKETVNEFEEKPSGVFYVRELSGKTYNPNISNGKLKGQTSTITLGTIDFINIEIDDELLYKGKRYRVQSMTEVVIEKASNISRRDTIERQIIAVGKE